MKNILIVCALLTIMMSCVAPKVTKENRFTKQFQQADSVFNKNTGYNED